MDDQTPAVVEVRGPDSPRFLHYALTSAVYPLKVGDTEPTNILDVDGEVIASGLLERADNTYRLHFESNSVTAAAWLQALSDGFVIHDKTDFYGKIPGPVAIKVLAGEAVKPMGESAQAGYAEGKDYFVGGNGAKYAGPKATALPKFEWHEPENAPIKTTSLHALHKDVLGAKMVPFAGYDMPVWYSSVGEEHAAVRTEAGLFDVTHMGVWEVNGPASNGLLNAITAHDITALR